MTARAPGSVGHDFLASAQAYPTAIAAIEPGGTSISYAQLATKANTLARRLSNAGICSGDIVAIAAPRSIDALVAIVGITLAGCAYLPVDPQLPSEFLKQVLSAAKPRIALVSDDRAGTLEAQGLQIWPLSSVNRDHDDEGISALRPVSGADAIYVMFTSGSTGQPKGVVIPHRAVQRLVVGQDYCQLSSGEVVLQAAPLAFDASTFEIWGALLNGGTLAIVPEDRPSLDRLTEIITDCGVTTAWLTAGLFHLLIDERIEAFSGLRQILAGGDVLSPDHVRRLQAAQPDLAIINGYGPTENTTFTCCATLPSGPWPSASAPVGRAINGTRTWIVDDSLQPVLPGEEGQLVTGGEGLAIGYLGDASLTDEKFVNAPSPIGERVYLTGDLARELPDGQIEFLGRDDRQLKIDGKRIEPATIEQALRGCSGISDATVVPETTATGVKRLIAFVVSHEADRDADRIAAEAMHSLRASLPDYLWPAQIRCVTALPLTANGKIDRKALLATPVATAQQPSSDSLESQIAAIWTDVLGIGEIGAEDNFFELGGRSLQLMRVHSALCRQTGRPVPITDLFAHPTVSGLARHLGSTRPAQPGAGASRSANHATRSNAIAIVGMSGRFPGARSIDEFWANQKAGTVSIRRFSDDELKDSFDAETRSDPAFIKARGVLENPADFDADLFGMNPNEARLTDPQHRVFLEVALEALERGGLDPQRFDGTVGVFAGASMPTYLIGNILSDPAAAGRFASTYQLDDMDTLVGSLPDALATRVAYKLGLHGPAITVLSACSTSAVAVVQACQNLILGQCDAALAGGVSITFPQERGYLAQDGGMGSDDGACRPMDAAASGTVFGSGAGVVLLKRLDDALAQGDHIHAVIRGSGIGNDGGGKGSFTAPSAAGQAQTIKAAHANAGVDPSTVGYVELHGTATPLGDPIEFSGLVEAFGKDCPAATCALGSAKGNIGHLDVAAGVTGLIKTALSIEEGVIVPLAGFERPNPHIALDNSPFRIETALKPWPETGSPRRAGISSFGVGGTNVHIVLEQAPCTEYPARTDTLQVLPLSAKTPEALDAMASALADQLESRPDLSLADAAYTLRAGRTARAERGAVVAASTEDAIAALRAPRRTVRETAAASPPVVFMFPGQGSQYPGMGAALYREEPVYRHWIDAGCDLHAAATGSDLRALLLAEDGSEEDAERLRQTAMAQPALLIVQHALARLWMERGIQPSAMIGHSVGEFVAATLSGVIRFEDALALVLRRGEMMQGVSPGSMLAVRTGEAELAPLLGAGIDIAAVNAPSLCVAAGPSAAVAELQARLEREGIDCRPLHTSHAFHSAMMDPVIAPLENLASGFAYAAAQIPYVSGVTGNWAGEGDTASGAYWARHCRAPVRFAEALATVVGDSRPILLEVGPGRALSTFAVQGLDRSAFRAAVQSLPDAADAQRSREAFYIAAARLWACGATPDWSNLYGSRAHKVPLPAYQFQRKTFWIEPQSRPSAAPAAAPSIIENLDISMTTTPEIQAAPVAAGSRQTAFVERLAAILEDLTGDPIGAGDADAPFLDLGFDSLLLGRVATKVQRDFGVKVTFRQLMGDFPTMAALAEHLDRQVPAEAAPAPAVAVAAATPLPAVTAVAQQAAVPAPTAAGLSAAFQAQLDAMQAVIARQLDVMRGMPAIPAADVPAPVLSQTAPSVIEVPVATSAPCEDTPEAPSRFRPYRPSAEQSDTLTPAQRELIADMTRRTEARMAQSKAQTQQHRDYFADPRSASGFRPEWKEMVFPIVAARSKGSKIWDVDGNEYIDLVNGYGQTAFGHAPDFVTEAVAAQLEKGFAIGPQSPLAGEVAAQFSKMVGMDRVTFCNTGSEAVMAAMRVARCVTGRDRVVVFNNDYHGQFDEVLVKAGGKASFGRAMPIAPGIPPEAVAQMVVLPYGAQESLDWIAANADEVAAVIVEPVQSRHPELRPFDFLRTLRSMTQDSEIALVFDEVVTGFRTHPGGMQAVLGIAADMATYGKVVGGGMPIGILAGSRRFLDALDGGSWQFGDDSFPEVAPTFFAGTFVRHPLVMAACKAVLDHIETSGPALQTALAGRCERLVEDLRKVFTDRGIEPPIHGYSSWFMLDLSGTDRLAGLFSHAMRLRGVHIIDGYPCFLTTAHSDEDIAAIVAAAAASLDELQAAGVLAGTGPAAAPSEPIVPLTEPQLEILLSAQMGAEASCAFNESISLRFDGAADSERLRQAINRFVARHDAMRAVLVPGQQTLRIAPSLTIDIPDVSADDEEFAAILTEEATTPFDLIEGPLLRGRIVQLTGGTTTLVITAHHIVFDGWTANVFAEEVAAIYRALEAGSEPDLDPVLPFSQYSAQRAARPAIGPTELDYWESLLASPPEPLSLPTDRPRQAIKTFKGATYSTSFDAVFTQGVRKAGAKLGCTLFATLLGALQVTLGRLADHNDVIIGCPTAGQALVEDHVLAGHCVNFLPLRAPFTPETTLGDHIVAVKNMALEAFDHQDVTYGAIVRALGIPRNPNRTPLTDIQFNLERLGEAIDFGGATASLLPNPKGAVNFDLFFNVVEGAEGLRFDIDYSTDLFDAATIARWTESLRQVLRSVVTDASQTIGSVTILGMEERAWLDARNARFARLPETDTLARRFADTAARYAGNQAVVSDDQRLSYAELDAQANRLANALVDQCGVGKGDRVAILAARSVQTVTAILAIIKAGAVYVPLDPPYPAARLAYMIGDADAKAILVGPGGGDAAAELGIDKRNSFDALFASASACPDTLPDVQIAADDPAYVMYTSGSTGRPKGVVAPHRAVLRLVSDQDFIHFGPDEVFLHLSSLAFDASTLELWGALLHGGSLAVVSSAKPSLSEIETAIHAHGVTTAWFTAALFHSMVDEGIEAMRPLRQVLAGGDVLSPHHVRKFIEACPQTLLVNGYGPTENTTFSACFRVTAGWTDGPVPIGQPIAHTSAFIVDGGLNLLPRGAVGELLVGGEGLALGYLGDEDLSAQRFVTAGFPDGERLYRTGDLARWKNDGTLEFVGRVDRQVKINGQRIEPAEIESVLREIDGIRDTAVIVTEGPNDSRQLHAFVVCEPGVLPDTAIAAARDLAARLLPAHMVPRSFRPIGSLPMNDNGKVDRHELAARCQAEPAPAQVESRQQPALPEELTATEQKIAAIWSDVLKVDSIARSDAIFDLGADSLQIFRIAARMDEQKLTLENRKLLANPTLQEVAAMVSDGVAESGTPVAAKRTSLSAYRRSGNALA